MKDYKWREREKLKNVVMEDGRKYRVDGMEIWIQLMEVKNKLNIVIGILVMCLILILYLGFKLGT